MDTISWVDADGAEHSLAGNGARALKGVEGRFMPPVGFVEEEVPLQPGARLRQPKTLVREVAVPVIFEAADEGELRSSLRAWLLRLNVDRGEGALRVEGPLGGVRELRCLYAGGMELVEDGQTAGADFQKAVVVFRAHDPYWYDQAQTVLQVAPGDEPGSFFPFFPLRLSSSEVFAAFTVDNSGDVDAWPVWEVHGPHDGLVLSNLTSDKRLSFTHSHEAGEVVEIDTRPGVKTVVMEGENLYEHLDAGSALWPLVRGPNTLRIEMAGAGAESLVVLRYRRRYLGA